VLVEPAPGDLVGVDWFYPGEARCPAFIGPSYTQVWLAGPNCTTQPVLPATHLHATIYYRSPNGDVNSTFSRSCASMFNPEPSAVAWDGTDT